MHLSLHGFHRKFFSFPSVTKSSKQIINYQTQFCTGVSISKKIQKMYCSKLKFLNDFSLQYLKLTFCWNWNDTPLLWKIHQKILKIHVKQLSKKSYAYGYAHNRKTRLYWASSYQCKNSWLSKYQFEHIDSLCSSYPPSWYSWINQCSIWRSDTNKTTPLNWLIYTFKKITQITTLSLMYEFLKI